METVIKTRIVKIGNSQGIRIPKLLLDQLGFGTDVEIAVQRNNLVIRPLQHPRHGWEQKFGALAEHGDGQLIDGDIVSLSIWHDEEWEW